MTSVATTPASGARGRHAEGHAFWSLTIIALDVVALWGLCAYGGRENLAAY